MDRHDDLSSCTNPMEKLLARLSEHHAPTREQIDAGKAAKDDGGYAAASNYQTASNSLPITPALDGPSTAMPATRPASASTSINNGMDAADELLRLKLELAQTQSKLSRLDLELAQTRNAQLESGQVTPALISPMPEVQEGI